MSRYKTEPNGTMVTTAPLFASVWMALFHVLRKNFNERRGAATANAECSQEQENKE